MSRWQAASGRGGWGSGLRGENGDPPRGRTENLRMSFIDYSSTPDVGLTFSMNPKISRNLRALPYSVRPLRAALVDVHPCVCHRPKDWSMPVMGGQVDREPRIPQVQTVPAEPRKPGASEPHVQYRNTSPRHSCQDAASYPG